jgi:4'-phosphopantetheinyl transferase
MLETRIPQDAWSRAPARLAEGDVHVWSMAVDGLAPAVLGDWHRLLDDGERATAARFVQAADTRQYIAAHALLRLMLSGFAAMAPARWRFAAGPQGKPTVHPDIPHGRLQFNLSHTRDAVACALALDHPIGVDIENTERPTFSLDLAESYFAADEVARLRAAAPAEQRAMFFRLWTLKEAAIKALGLGLGVPLDQVAFGLSPVRVRFDPALGEDAAHWHFAAADPVPRCMLAVAVRAAAPVRMRFRTLRADDPDLAVPV